MHTICVAGILPARAEGVPPSKETVYTAHPTIEQTLAAIRDSMTRSPAPWLEVWQQEYIAAIRKAMASHEDDPRYARRLEILREGFEPYWKGLRNNEDRSLFEVRLAHIRWFIEHLMSAELPSEEGRQKLCDQYKDLAEHATQSLLTQFSFLDPNRVQKAKADHIADCYRNIDTPLLPIFLTPFSEAQIDQIKQRWHDLRYARVDLWRSLGGHDLVETQNLASPRAEPKPPTEHADYLLTQRSLDQLQAHIWAFGAPAPDYYRTAVQNQIDTQKRWLQSGVDARNQEMHLSVAVVQTEYLSFLLAALLETAQCYPEEAN